MSHGDNICIDIADTAPHFTDFDSEGTFDANIFFNWEEMAKEQQYMQYVKENENHRRGSSDFGGYTRSNNFGMMLRSGAETEE